MFSINNLKMMEVIDINTGSKLGYIKDLKINCREYKVESILLPSQSQSWFGKNQDIEIPWESIKKIGVDVILIEMDDSIIKDEE